MIVKDKVSLMSKMAIFEKSANGKKVLSDVGFFKSDHLRWDLLKTGASVTVGYALILALIILYNLEYLIKNSGNISNCNGGLSDIYIFIFCIQFFQ